jgi:hypothetical protein
VAADGDRVRRGRPRCRRARGGRGWSRRPPWSPGPHRCRPGGDVGLGVGVDGAGRLVEDEHLGVGPQGGGQHDALALAARQRPSPFGQLGVEPVGQAVDDVGGGGGLEGLGHRRSAP